MILRSVIQAIDRHRAIQSIPRMSKVTFCWVHRRCRPVVVHHQIGFWDPSCIKTSSGVWIWMIKRQVVGWRLFFGWVSAVWWAMRLWIWVCLFDFPSLQLINFMDWSNFTQIHRPNCLRRVVMDVGTSLGRDGGLDDSFETDPSADRWLTPGCEGWVWMRPRLGSTSSFGTMVDPTAARGWRCGCIHGFSTSKCPRSSQVVWSKLIGIELNVGGHLPRHARKSSPSSCVLGTLVRKSHTVGNATGRAFRQVHSHQHPSPSPWQMVCQVAERQGYFPPYVEKQKPRLATWARRVSISANRWSKDRARWCQNDAHDQPKKNRWPRGACPRALQSPSLPSELHRGGLMTLAERWHWHGHDGSCDDWSVVGKPSKTSAHVLAKNCILHKWESVVAQSDKKKRILVYVDHHRHHQHRNHHHHGHATPASNFRILISIMPAVGHASRIVWHCHWIFDWWGRVWLVFDK